jgi:CRP-like cAMP-binding protein
MRESRGHLKENRSHIMRCVSDRCVAVEGRVFRALFSETKDPRLRASIQQSMRRRQGAHSTRETARSPA